MKIIPYGRQSISEDDINAVVEVLRSDFLTQGPAIDAFETKVAQYCGANYAVAVSSATSALHIACLALGVGPGDVVWTTPITFVATANCARYCGADVDFVDIDSRTYNISVERLAEKLAAAKKSNRLPKVVIPVHLAGQSCEMEAIHSLSKQYGFRIIEDASHAIGGEYQERKIGCCQFSDITVFSFHPVKIITTGEGGVATSNRLELVKRMLLLRNHGITRNSEEMTHEPDGAWYYQQVDLGFNYRMTDLQAALGLSQMDRLNDFVLRRNLIARRYEELLRNSKILAPWFHPDTRPAMHLYIVRVPAKNHRLLFDYMRSNGIGVNLHYIPLFRQPYYKNFGYKQEDYPEAERFYAEAISMPLYPDLTEEEQDKVVRCLLAAGDIPGSA